MDTIVISKKYLEPTNLVDFNTPIVQQKALGLTKNSRSEMEKVKGIYNYVRDDIPYTFTHNLQKTSDVLKEYIGQCNTKRP